MLTEAESELSEQRLQLLADGIIEAANAAGIGLIVTTLNDPEHPALYVSQAAARIWVMRIKISWRGRYSR